MQIRVVAGYLSNVCVGLAASALALGILLVPNVAHAGPPPDVAACTCDGSNCTGNTQGDCAMLGSLGR